MKVNFNPTVSNISFKALTKRAEKILRTYMEGQPEYIKDLLEDQIKEENEKIMRSIDISHRIQTDTARPWRNVLLRKVTAKDFHTNDTYITTMDCTRIGGFSQVTEKINRIM